MKNGRSVKQMKSTSKFISLILRHKPEVIGIVLDEHGCRARTASARSRLSARSVLNDAHRASGPSRNAHGSGWADVRELIVGVNHAEGHYLDMDISCE